MDAQADGGTLISHLEELRRRLLRILTVTALVYPAAYFVSPYVIKFLVDFCFPAEAGQLHFFSPMEVFFTQLKLALILSLIAACPWNIRQIWAFLLPALYPDERKALGWWIVGASALFFAGTAFCITMILPLLMRFAAGFASDEIRPMLGLANFLNLAGWLSLAFGLMFQAPIAVLLAVRFGFISAESLRRKRPYIATVILVASAILTPPDVVSQLLLAVPTWLLFEAGLLLAGRMEKNAASYRRAVKKGGKTDGQTRIS